MVSHLTLGNLTLAFHTFLTFHTFLKYLTLGFPVKPVFFWVGFLAHFSGWGFWHNMGQNPHPLYYYLYLKSDVLLLADVFEEFRNVCLENYSLDPAWYYTSPGLSWDALLRHSKIKLELLTDPDVLLLFEKGIRGGVSMIPNRYGKANNKFLGDTFDPSQPSKFITYLDANNLYGWAMMKPLPVGDFKWMDEKEMENLEDTPCILEVDLDYPKDLHDLHNDYPLAPKRLKFGGVEKLIPNLWDKEKYIVHHYILN